MNTKIHTSSILSVGFHALVLLGLLLFVTSLRAQESLRSMVQSGGAEWMVGKWTGTNSQGRAVTVEYEWELDGHVLEVDLEIGAESYKGLITREPKDGEIVEFGADSRGGATRATWREENGLIISERTATRSDGRAIRVAVVNEKRDADTVVATMHPISPDGQLGKEVMDTVNLKRQPAADSED